ncbi:glycoside hydrolase family 25 domain-containing protein [Stakelama tenebrarum]|uniref:Calcium-binding protein n=1 Tax=Stakelama tenebrarum TaxID=2711215 RepID=A0A6G6Y2N2_9SPHN|nr:hypothetical protein [Sphingosinithalassobacter tenebrarum]QIG78978.1 hypothetical protein G5C33_03705 [Sphingosinithalassobacter tenebrarum]
MFRPLLRALALTLCVTLALAAAAQGPAMSDAAREANTRSYRALQQGDYLRAEELLRPHAFDAEGNPVDGFIYSSWAEAMTLMTGEPPAREPDGRTARAEYLAAIADADTRDAIAEIVERARHTSIVFLNEDHGVPRSRAFGLQVAEALRPLGYTILAVETLQNDADLDTVDSRIAAINADGYIRRDSGYYTHDPVFADFLRQAMAAGYRLAAYEQTPDLRTTDPELSIPKREQAQADYLLNRVVNRNPGAKLLVYVGFSHATEETQEPDGVALRWLAARIKAMTGIDPLTIDQTTLMRSGAAARSDALVDAATARAQGRSVVFLSPDGSPLVIGRYAGLVDLQVVHPDLPRVGDRPGWIPALLHRTPTPVPAELLPETGTVLIQAFVATEGDAAIPVDQLLVTAGEAPGMLMLPDMPVRYAVQTPE